MYVIKSNRQTNSYTVRKINRITQVVRVGRRGLQGEPGATGPKGDQGDPATNLVQSVNGKQGIVVLNATDVGADTAGSSSQALQDAKDYTDTEVSTLGSSLATVAKTGSYNDLSNKPTVPSIAGLATETYVNNAVAPKANTSDLGTAAFEDVEDLPVSTATQTALNAKANASDTVNLTGDQTIAGVKTFSSSPVVPTATTNNQAVNKAQMDALAPIYGTGMPNGVVAASVGRIYMDTAITNGASSWIKKSGTGNTGWVVSVGDTGWRDISSLLASGWSCTKVQLRRDSSGITIRASGLSGISATSTLFLSGIPVGFRLYTVAESFAVVEEAGNTTYFGLVGVGGQVYINVTRGIAKSLYLKASYSAQDTWPSTLPGTAA